MSYISSQYHKSWGEIFAQSLFWLCRFAVFWYLYSSGVSTNEGLIVQLLQFRSHSTDSTTAATINSNTCSRWESFRHHEIQCKWHWQKLTELGEFLERHNLKVPVIHESKLSSNYRTPSIQNFATLRTVVKAKEVVYPP